MRFSKGQDIRKPYWLYTAMKYKVGDIVRRAWDPHDCGCTEIGQIIEIWGSSVSIAWFGRDDSVFYNTEHLRLHCYAV